MSTLPFTQEELACIEAVNKANTQDKPWIFQKACNMIQDKTRITVLALTLWLIWPVFWNQNTIFSITDESSIQKSNLPDEAKPVIPTLQEISRKQAELLAKWEISQFFPVQVQIIHGIQNKSDLDSIQTWMSNQPTISFQELTGSNTLKYSWENKNYVPSMLAIYSLWKNQTQDQSWRQQLQTNGIKINYAPEQIEKFNQEATKTWWLYAKTKPTEWVSAQEKWVMSPEAHNEYEKLFNEWLKRIPNILQTKGLLARYDQACKEIIEYFFSTNPKVRNSPNVAYFIGELMLMTQKDVKVISVQIGWVKYNFVSKEDIEKSLFKEMSYGDKVASIFQTALEQFIPQAGKESQSIQLARDIKSINQEIARDKQEIAQSKQNISKMDQEIARDKQEISMLDKANLLRDEIYAIILKFNPDDKQTLERIQEKLNELNNLRNGIDKKSKTYEILVWVYQQSLWMVKKKWFNV